MLDIDSLLADLAAEGLVSKPCQLDKAGAWGEDDRAFIILQGTALLRDSTVFSADVHATQTFEAGDPIGIAERPLASVHGGPPLPSRRHCRWFRLKALRSDRR